MKTIKRHSISMPRMAAASPSDTVAVEETTIVLLPLVNAETLAVSKVVVRVS